MKEYQGHRSWNAWNVYLWISNDYNLYSLAQDCIAKAKAQWDKVVERKPERAEDTTFMQNFITSCAAIKFMRVVKGDRTPDGGVYNKLAVKLALESLI